MFAHGRFDNGAKHVICGTTPRLPPPGGQVRRRKRRITRPKEAAMSETPPEEVDADLDDPIEPRMNPAEDPDVESDGDGDDTLVSEGDPPSTAND